MIDLYGLECPYCKKLTLLNDVEAQAVACRRLNIVQKTWNNLIEGINRTEILKFIFRERERKLNELSSLYTIDIMSLVAKSQLMKEIVGLENNNKTKLSLTQNEIVKTYELVIIERSRFEHIKSGLVKLLCYEKYRPNCMTDKEILDNFKPVYTEEYVMIKNDYKKYDLITENDTDIIEKYQKENKQLVNQSIKFKPNISPTERTKNAYNVIGD